MNVVYYVYDGMRVIQERDSNNTPAVSYTRGIDLSGSLEGAGGIGGLLARSQRLLLAATGPATTCYHADGNGNITCLINSSQTMVASYRYDPFGNTISSRAAAWPIANVYRFSSKEIHVNSGMYYYGYRFYDPSLQRWINRDPLGDQTRAQAFLSEPAGVKSNANHMPFDALEGPNPYGFVHNQPTIGYDADGLIAESPACLAARISANILRRLIRRYPANTYYLACTPSPLQRKSRSVAARPRRDTSSLCRVPSVGETTIPTSVGSG